MGGGSFNSVCYTSSVASRGYDHKSIRETFRAKNVNVAMNPYDVDTRESRDSEEHPESLAIILALDVTGSMGSIPHHLIKCGLPTIMDTILKKNVKDPQILFTAIGDHECDSSPFQVAQFESSDEMLLHWLENVFLEGGGGGNSGESYLLAWYFAGYRTSIDCFEKRGKKGFLFTVGDEPTLPSVPETSMKHIFGNGQYEDFRAVSLLDRAREKYNVYHIHVKQGLNGRSSGTIDGWKQLMGDSLVLVDDYRQIPEVIAQKIIAGGSETKDATIDITRQNQHL